MAFDNLLDDDFYIKVFQVGYWLVFIYLLYFRLAYSYAFGHDYCNLPIRMKRLVEEVASSADHDSTLISLLEYQEKFKFIKKLCDMLNQTVIFSSAKVIDDFELMEQYTRGIKKTAYKKLLLRVEFKKIVASKELKPVFDYFDAQLERLTRHHFLGRKEFSDEVLNFSDEQLIRPQTAGEVQYLSKDLNISTEVLEGSNNGITQNISLDETN